MLSTSCYIEGKRSASCYLHGYTPGSSIAKNIKDASYLKNKNNPTYQKDLKDSFKSMAKDYLATEGKNLESYLSSIGKSADVKEYGTANLGDDKTIASLLTYADASNNRKESVMLGNNYGKGFESRLERMASKYGLTPKEAFEYVMVHETMHAAGYNSEMETEMAAKNFFNHMIARSDAKRAEKYQKLANAASTRIQELGLIGLEKYVAKYYTHGKHVQKNYSNKFKN